MDIAQRSWQETFAAAKKGSDEVALILTDPPYGATRNEWDQPIDENKFVSACFDLMSDRGVLVSTTTEPFTSKMVSALGNKFRYCWYWHKRLGTNFLNAKKQPLRVIEPIVVGYRKQPNYSPQMTSNPRGAVSWSRKDCGATESYGKYKENVVYKSEGKRYPTTLLEFYMAPKEKIHPTQKPVELFKYIIETYTREGDLVVDPFLGSGTTAVACAMTKRKFIGGDILNKYVSQSAERLKHF